MPAPLSAIDAISPAFERTKRQLFQPFRLAFWLRMALVALATGEFYNSGWSGIHFTLPARRGGSGLFFALAARPQWEFLKRYLPWIVLAGLLVFAVVTLWIYVGSVFRFVLFDSVLTGRCGIREEWRQRQGLGTRFFLWRICLALGVMAAIAIPAGAAALVLLRAGAFGHPRQHIGLLVLVALLAFLVVACLMALGALIAMFARDFVVPVMALENVGVLEGWRRVIRMLKMEKKAYAGYVLMKIVLVVGSAILFGILTLIAVLLLFIPLSIAGVGGYFFARAAGLGWSFTTIALGVALGAVVAALALYVMALVCAPAMVFFQAYVIHFLGSRFAPLGERISTPPAPAGRTGPPAFPEAGALPIG